MTRIVKKYGLKNFAMLLMVVFAKKGYNNSIKRFSKVSKFTVFVKVPPNPSVSTNAYILGKVEHWSGAYSGM
ncbi:hypothetical protein BMT55_12185 [Listeria newyorkensis]|uniref:Uncharacterized protein n=1 Tax=Listeria newyorkensis TaxID=1497681 RepID=A0ABX4XMF3_9LIST|nr:hypothetical protein EP56_15550 [Listeriaceae bacterium FSL A5-0209]KGL46012.1 hypothetical protein EP58_02410 [Listeria newyorkensis]PNP90561.1 hypothetical protein BMT55_12185 [Listeria newyorkensis]RQW67928.1 hypothetical protein DUK53_00670 [Listeria sp. SHR_NRA_18]